MTRASLRVAVTGTDTGVGKTVVACALVAALRERGLAVAAMKPAETGIVARDGASDAERLRWATGDADPLDVVCPVTLAEPLAPWVAAERAGRPLDLPPLDSALARLETGRDAIVVEGAGGLLVPFTRALAFADLVARWALDLVVVAANRLGVINHTLLTVREAERRGLMVRAVALVDPPHAEHAVAERTNGDVLVELLAPVPVVRVPRLTAVELHDLAALARAGDAIAELLGTAAVPPAARHAARSATT
jgi:dethiobiotin synthetase